MKKDMKNKKYRHRNKEDENNQPVSFTKPDAKWYRSIKLWFGAFLGLILIRMIFFVYSQGKFNFDDIWLRILLVSLGTLIAWWYVSKREKKS